MDEKELIQEKRSRQHIIHNHKEELERIITLCKKTNQKAATDDASTQAVLKIEEYEALKPFVGYCCGRPKQDGLVIINESGKKEDIEFDRNYIFHKTCYDTLFNEGVNEFYKEVLPPGMRNLRTN